MATVGNLCTTIIGDLGRGDTSLSDIVLIDIQSSIRDYEAQRFYFNEKLISLTISATNTYALSLFATAGSVADIVEVDGVEVVVSSTRTYPLIPKPARAILDMQGNGDTGAPNFWSIYNQSLIIESQPSITGYSFNLAAHVKFTEIAAGGFATSNVWTNDASELIRNATLKRLWGRRFRDYEAAQAAAVAERDAYAALRRRTDALSGGRLDSYL